MLVRQLLLLLVIQIANARASVPEDFDREDIELCIDGLELCGTYGRLSTTVQGWKTQAVVEAPRHYHDELRRRGNDDFSNRLLDITRTCPSLRGAWNTFGDTLQRLGHLLRGEGQSVRMVDWQDQEVGARHRDQSGYFVVRRIRNWPGPVERTEFMQVTIRPHHVGPREGSFSRAITQQHGYQLGSQSGDEAGHILANTLGGPNTRINFFPQASANNANRGVSWILNSWFDNENNIRRFLNQNAGSQVVLRVALRYVDDTAGRPYDVVYSTTFLDRNYRQLYHLETNGNLPNTNQSSLGCRRRVRRRYRGTHPYKTHRRPKNYYLD